MKQRGCSKCSKTSVCPGFCGSGPKSCRHGCSKVLVATNICWNTDHQEPACHN